MILVPSVPSPVPTVPTVSHPRLSPLTPLLPPLLSPLCLGIPGFVPKVPLRVPNSPDSAAVCGGICFFPFDPPAVRPPANPCRPWSVPLAKSPLAAQGDLFDVPRWGMADHGSRQEQQMPFRVTINGREQDVRQITAEDALISWTQKYVRSCKHPNMMRSWLFDIARGPEESNWKDPMKVQAVVNAAFEMGMSEDVKDILGVDVGSPSPAPVG